ncbi:MAG: CehA/McbA family metallohydrolase [Gemmatimonadota bacterium]
MRVLTGIMTCGGFLAAPLMAQREAVLKQIRVPHNYYYREMYLPQVTSGPGAATWSPDGKTIVYSMQGTLWRQQIGSDRTVQVTDGEAYDYQPDWSPDGRYVVYVSYLHDALELWLLEVATGKTSAIRADGSVNLEPRWSPDGKRLAFVSTSYEGRWHIFTADFRDGAFANVSRLTEDRDSQLPRYYYSRYDHYLSPTWSPDGRELILISNRNHIWGSGSFWRMAADSGGTPREIHDEETTWRARPDWSRDGRRVVYSSYQGRQRNQLWVMTADGENPFQLTYGDFDATDPRWSPDGKSIVYVSNADGNTGLWIVSVPGGTITRLQVRERVYRRAPGRLHLAIADSATGAPMTARVSVSLPDGRSFAPDDTWRYADDSYIRAERQFEYGYFHTNGTTTLSLPAGTYRVEVSRGPEYAVVRRTVVVEGNRAHSLRVRMSRLANMPIRGWTSGDLHVHMNYGGHYRATPATLALQAHAEGLQVVEDLIVNKEGRIPDLDRFTGHLDPASTSSLAIAHDQEFHTSFWGHTGILGLSDHLILPGYSAYTHTAAASLYPDNAAIADLAHAQDALFGYVHPFDEYPDPSRADVPLTTELPVDVALGKVDYYEVMGFSDHLSSARVWYQLLNCGFRIPAGAGTDAMTNYASLRGPVGTARVYVQSGLPLNYPRWLEALKQGKTFVTNGPLLGFRSGTTQIGGEIHLAAAQSIPFTIWFRSLVSIDHLEVVSEGKVVATIPMAGDRTRADTTISLPVERSGWYTLRAWSEKPVEPILDLYPFSSTSPIYVSVAGAPIRSADDARYFLTWIDRLAAAAGGFKDWNDEGEQEAVMGHIRDARAEFERRVGE